MIFADPHFHGDGISEPVGVSQLVERVIISPHSSDTEVDKIRSIVNQHCLGVAVCDSDLKNPPDETLCVGSDNNIVRFGLQDAENNNRKVRVRLRRGQVNTIGGGFRFSQYSYYEGIPKCTSSNGFDRSVVYELVQEDSSGIVFNAHEVLEYIEI